jgi:flagellum-specific peptidoglycan hydrolase FlgJ
MNKKLFILFFTLFLASCSTYKNGRNKTYTPTKRLPTATSKNSIPTQTKPSKAAQVITISSQDYINQFKNTAINNMKTYAIPASIILAQGLLESGTGKSELSRNSNNHFGIKCTSDWNGDKVYHDDDKAQECFRKYNNPSESYRDHALFLTTRTRYAALFNLPKDDYKAWANGLSKAGYATDPQYPQKLINLIELYNLHQFDTEAMGKNIPKVDSEVKYTNNNYHTVEKGDTLYSLSKKYNIEIETLKTMNNLTDNNLSIGSQLLIKKI